jgi:hypothetical protein
MQPTDQTPWEQRRNQLTETYKKLLRSFVWVILISYTILGIVLSELLARFLGMEWTRGLARLVDRAIAPVMALAGLGLAARVAWLERHATRRAALAIATANYPDHISEDSLCEGYWSPRLIARLLDPPEIIVNYPIEGLYGRYDIKFYDASRVREAEAAAGVVHDKPASAQFCTGGQEESGRGITDLTAGSQTMQGTKPRRRKAEPIRVSIEALGAVDEGRQRHLG